MRRTITTAIVSGAAMLALLIQPFLLPQDAGAVTAADWQAGNIIDDAIFTNTSAMTVSQIQSWLDTRLQNCDYYGTKPSELSGGIDYDKNGVVTRAEYGRTMGNPAPFTCLNDYYEVPKTAPSSTLPANNYGTSTIPSGAKSAAQLIYDTAQAYNISPKVLLVKLGTESAGPLTSDPWPFERQYLYAMGAHCPDSGPGGSANCDSDYAGFSLQIREAAKLLRWYLDSMSESWWPYKKPYATNYILWNVEPTGCGGSNVFIKNKATAALYTYTPYQPNKAALNNLYGTGDGCSAYGNRNFWRVYNDWFGLTIAYLPYAIRYDTSTDKTGDYARVGYGLHKKPTSNVTLTFTVSSPSNARIVGSSSVTITPNTWNQPEKNMVTVAGKDNLGLTGSFSYWVIPTSHAITDDPNYKNLSASLMPRVELIQNDTNSPRTVYRLRNTALQQHTFTANLMLVNELRSAGWVTENSGFEYCETGEMSILRLRKGNEHKLAIQNSKSLKDDIANGYQIEDIALSTSAQGDVPVYRMYNDTDPNNVRTLYLADTSEVAGNNAWKNGGIAFYGCRSGSVSVYRLYKPGGSHFYTASARERNKAIYDLRYRYEGLGFYTCKDLGGQPVHRFIKASTGVRFYTSSEREKQKVLDTLRDYRYEGVAFRLCDSGRTDVYRHYKVSSGQRFFTASPSESTSAVNQHGYKLEGIGFTSL